MNKWSVARTMSPNQWQSWREPVSDGRYFARLAPSDCLDFIDEDFDNYRGRFLRVNYKAAIVGAIDVPPGFWQRSAYGHLRSSRDRFEIHSSLTSFLGKFYSFKPPMSTAR